MTIQYINTGSSANAGNGDSLRSAFIKVNSNFNYLSTASFGGAGTGYTGSRGSTGTNGYTGSQGNIGYTGSVPNLPSIANTAPSSGSIAYYNTTGTIIGAARLLINDQNGSLSILGNGASPVLNVTQNLYTSGSIFRTAQFHENIDASNFTFLRARGSPEAPQTLQVGDEIGEISWDTYDSTGTYVAGALLATVVDQAPTSGHVPMSFRFITDNGTAFETRMTISSTGTVRFNRLTALGTATTIEVGSNVIPTANVTYDLGSTSSQWRSLYVGTSTIYIGGVAVSVAGGNLTINGNPVSASTATGYTGSQGSTGTVGYTGSASTATGYTGSQGSTGTVGYTGSASTATGYTGSQGPSGSATTSTLINGASTVSLSSTGKLTLSTAGIVRSGTDTAQVGYQAVFTQDIYGNTATGQVSGQTYVNVGTNAQMLALIDPASQFSNLLYNLLSPITITYSDATTQTFTEVRITNTSSGSVIGFGYNATTVGHNFPITAQTANYAAATPAPEWTFGSNGALTFPDTSVQTKAYTGIPGPYANDAAAAAANVAVGNPYHKTGTGGQVFVRLT